MGEPPEEIERARRFAWELEGIFDDEMVSAVLYGSAARGEYRPGISDLNLLVLLRQVTPAGLRRAGELSRAWVAERNPPPLILAVDEWRGSADVWAIEMADIRDAHLVLVGSDPFHGITIDPKCLRLQCEKELKGKQLQLRERYLLFAGSPDELGELLTKSFSTFLVLFRTVLRLSGDAGTREAGEVVLRVGERAGFNPGPLLDIHRARQSGERVRPAAESPLAVGYLEAVSSVVHYVDRLVHGDGARA